MASNPKNNSYTMGYSKATTASHEARTVESDAAFVLPYLKPDFKVLDAGCGPGTITCGFAEIAKNGSVVGIDIGQEILDRAQEYAKSKQLNHRIDFRQANLLEGLPFEDNTFDVVFCSQVIGHLGPQPEAPIKAMKEIRRVLKPGGIFAAREASFMHWYPYEQELDRLVSKNVNRGAKTRFCGPFMKSWCQEAGFDVNDHEKAKWGGSTTIHADREGIEMWGSSLIGRLSPGDTFRKSWTATGVSDEECDEAMEMLRKWMESPGAWYGMLQSDTLVWK